MAGVENLVDKPIVKLHSRNPSADKVDAENKQNSADGCG